MRHGGASQSSGSPRKKYRESRKKLVASIWSGCQGLGLRVARVPLVGVPDIGPDKQWVGRPGYFCSCYPSILVVKGRVGSIASASGAQPLSRPGLTVRALRRCASMGRIEWRGCYECLYY